MAHQTRRDLAEIFVSYRTMLNSDGNHYNFKQLLRQYLDDEGQLQFPPPLPDGWGEDPLAL
jgi:hypothetical protein